MDCTPNALSEAANCLAAVPRGYLDAIDTYLSCQIAGGGSGPANDGFLLEDGSGVILLETGDRYLLE
jgi:hypothetical protein